jgi:hypothetical protein
MKEGTIHLETPCRQKMGKQPINFKGSPYRFLLLIALKRKPGFARAYYYLASSHNWKFDVILALK